jgi:Rho-type GTPase-activating protein 1/2
VKRASRSAFQGFTLARDEYDKEVASRKEMEATMARLQKRVAEQASQLAKLDFVSKESDSIQRQSRELQITVSDMQEQLNKLKIERDMTVAEVEELSFAATSFDEARG